MSALGSRGTVLQRFFRRVELCPDGCWQWIGTIDRHGYGSFTVDDFTYKAHRLAYELLVDVVPPDLPLDHLCRRRACVNPRHLEAVSLRENIKRGANHVATQMRQTHCLRGHELAPENLKLDRGGRRICRRCANERTRASRRSVVASTSASREVRGAVAAGVLGTTEQMEGPYSARFPSVHSESDNSGERSLEHGRPHSRSG